MPNVSSSLKCILIVQLNYQSQTQSGLMMRIVGNRLYKIYTLIICLHLMSKP